MNYYDIRAKDLDPTPRPRKRYGYFTENHGAGTVAEALAWCERQGLDPAEVRLNQSFVDWEGVETSDEVRLRLEAAAKSQDNHLKAIREMYEDYKGRGLI
jgi:hypothetical protein